MVDSKLVDKQVFRTLIPANSLNAENFQELASHAKLEELPTGRFLFKKGEMDRKAVYVLSGEVELTGEDGTTIIRGGTPESCHPLANQQPRQMSARTKSNCTITRLDIDLFDILLTWDQLSGIEVQDITLLNDPDEEDGDEPSSDWMTRILQSKAFLRIPPPNIQAMFMRLQEMPVKAGWEIIKQGDEGDFYYIICRGKCTVTRESASGASVTLAQLGNGDAFGEEALLSNAKRNATIRMETDGLLMRLSKSDFEELLKAPVLHNVSFDEATEMVDGGTAAFLDVRLESEHKAGCIEGSHNIPLFMLRLKAEELDAGKRYICYCETGRRSSAAAFLMSERGFESCVLRGGLQSMPEPVKAKPTPK